MSFLSEFREFAVKGNAMDLAVGVVVGAAFQRIVTSLVNDVIMPPLGAITGGVDFSDLYINLSASPAASLAEAREAGIPVLAYGAFVNEVVNFLIVAMALFMIVKLMNKLRRAKA